MPLNKRAPEHHIFQVAHAHFSLHLNILAVFQPTAVFILFDTQIVPYVVSEGAFKLDKYLLSYTFYFDSSLTSWHDSLFQFPAPTILCGGKWY